MFSMLAELPFVCQTIQTDIDVLNKDPWLGNNFINIPTKGFHSKLQFLLVLFASGFVWYLTYVMLVVNACCAVCVQAS